MKSYKTLSIVPLMLGVSLLAATQARAGDYGGGGAGLGRFLGGWGNWSMASPYSLGQIPVPPYFSLHPPVYYSYPVPRTYGYSPYAYPGHVMTPDVFVAPTPEVIDNPYCPTSLKPATGEATPSGDEFASKSLEIINPYVQQINRQELNAAPVLAKARGPN